MFRLYTERQMHEKINAELSKIAYERYINSRFTDIWDRINALEKRLHSIERGGKPDGMDFCKTTNAAKV